MYNTKPCQAINHLATVKDLYSNNIHNKIFSIFLYTYSVIIIINKISGSNIKQIYMKKSMIFSGLIKLMNNKK